MNLKLYPFQVDGVSFLQSALQRKLLADEMGLGKSPQYLRATGDRANVVAPAGLKYSTRDECMKWRPDLKPIIMMSSDTAGQTSFKLAGAGELVICGYNQLPDWLEAPPHKSGFATGDKSREAKARRKELAKARKLFNSKLQAMERYAHPGILIYDEAHYVKNPKAKRSQRARILSALFNRVWMLTGTPMTRGNPYDTWGMLWAGQMELEAFRHFKHFEDVAGVRYDHFGQVTGYKPGRRFAEAMKNVMLRRTVEQVAPHMPEKIFRSLTVDMELEAQSILSEVPSDVIEAIRAARSPQCLDRVRLMPGFSEFSARRRDLAVARIPHMLDYVELCEANELRSLVFSAHRAPILSLSKRKGWAVIHGGVTSDDRQCIARNQNNYFGVGLSIGAGGTGLNLGGFHNAVFVDQAWDVEQNRQAIKRNHRINCDDGIPRTYTFMTSDAEIDRLVTEKQIEALENINRGIEGL